MDFEIVEPFGSLKELAIVGKIPRYIVCGVDLYRSKQCADEDRAFIEESKPLESRLINPMDKSYQDQFLSNRHYRIVDLFDPKDYNSQTTIADVIKELKPKKCPGGLVNVICREVVEQTGDDATYILTPLTEAELKELEQG